MANIGYYDTGLGSGNDKQADEIVELGQTAVSVNSLTPAVLATLQVLVIEHRGSGPVNAAVLAAMPDILAAVANGLVVVINDWSVTDSSGLFPGGSGLQFTRDFQSGGQVQMNLGPDGALIASSPFGTVTDVSLDNGNFSNHGYVDAASLPVGSEILMTRDNPDHVTAFSYFHGLGAIVYTTVPLQFYGDSAPGSSGVWEDFYVNVLNHALTLVAAPANTAPVAEDDAITAVENTSTVIAVLANDTDAESDPLLVTHVDGMAISTGQTVTLASGSTVTLTANGTLVYRSGATVNQLNLGETGEEVFTYTIADAETGGLTDVGTVTVTVEGRYTVISGATNKADTLNGTAFDDEINGLAGNDKLFGGDGDDILNGGGGGQLDADVMTGGQGDDFYFVDSTRDTIRELAGEGTDTVSSSVSYTLASAVENLILTGTAVVGTGNAEANEITGNMMGNTLNGGAGNDEIDGREGADVIWGGAGGDTLMGGSGGDTFLYKLVSESNASVAVGAPRGAAKAAQQSAPGSNTDLILDFSVSEGDKIDLRQIDAQTNKAGNQDFTIVDSFTGVSGQMTIKTYGVLNMVSEDGGPADGPATWGYILEADVNGDRTADFTLMVNSQAPLTVAQLSTALLGVAAVNITAIGSHAAAPSAIQTTIPDLF
ncbi:MAG: Ig-like domain-containing protein [Caulobacter sp.]